MKKQQLLIYAFVVSYGVPNEGNKGMKEDISPELLNIVQKARAIARLLVGDQVEADELVKTALTQSTGTHLEMPFKMRVYRLICEAHRKSHKGFDAAICGEPLPARLARELSKLRPRERIALVIAEVAEMQRPNAARTTGYQLTSLKTLISDARRKLVQGCTGATTDAA